MGLLVCLCLGGFVSKSCGQKWNPIHFQSNYGWVYSYDFQHNRGIQLKFQEWVTQKAH